MWTLGDLALLIALPAAGLALILVGVTVIRRAQGQRRAVAGAFVQGDSRETGDELPPDARRQGGLDVSGAAAREMNDPVFFSRVSAMRDRIQRAEAEWRKPIVRSDGPEGGG